MVRRIVIHHSNENLFGIQLYDKDNNLLFQSQKESNCKNRSTKETILGESERIIGFKSSDWCENYVDHNNF